MDKKCGREQDKREEIKRKLFQQIYVKIDERRATTNYRKQKNINNNKDNCNKKTTKEERI